MKKILLLAITLLLVSLMFADVTIGTGTTAGYYPLSSYYGFMRNSALYLQTEIGSAITIDKLQWYVSTSTTVSIPIKIYLKHTSATTQSGATWASVIDGATLVFDGNRTPSPTGWYEINITDFAYNGTDNLLVMVETNYGGGGSTPYAQMRYSTTATNMTLRAQQDTSAPTSVTTSTQRPNITLVTPVLTAMLTVAPNPVAFSGNTYVGLTRTQTVTLSNTGVANMTINADGITIGGRSYFTLANLPTLPYELIPNASVTFDVIYEPEAVGSHADTLFISDSRASTQYNITGTAAALNTGEICEAPYVIASLPLVDYAGTTTGFANDYTQTMFAGYSGSYANGRDWVAKVTVPEWGRLTCTITNPVGDVTNYYTGAFLVSTIPSLASPATIIASLTGAGNSFNANVAAGDYYIIVDNWPSPDVINFVMNVSFTAPSAAPNVATLGTPTPTGVVAVAPTATLNWVAPAAGEPVQGYYLYFGTDGGGTVTPTNIVNGTALASNVLTYNPDPDMSLDTTYYWQIVPYNPIGNATSCPIWSFKTVGYPLTGTKTIGVGGDFTSFTEAVNELNGAGIGEGGVTFNVLAGSVFTEEVPAITATGTAANPVVFQKSGEGANPVVRPTTGTQGIRISGGDYFTFDGIDIAVASGQIPNYGYYVANASATNGARNNVIKNCKITLNKANTSTKGIYDYYVTTPTSADGINANNTYQNITIENANTGIYVYGHSTYKTFGNVIRDCTIGAATADDMGGSSSGYGIYSYYQTGAQIYNNVIRNFTCTSAVYGIYHYYGDTAASIYGNTISALKTSSTYSEAYGIYGYWATGTMDIYNNRISSVGLTSTTTTSYYAYGIRASLSSTGTNVANVYNNMVWDIYSSYTGSGSTNYLTRGIHLDAATATNTYNVDYNSIRVAGPTSANSAGVYFAANSAVNKLRNNVITNYTGAQTGSYIHPCVYFSNATTIGAATSVSNNNVLFVANATNGPLVRGGTTSYGTLAAWTTASTHDAASRPTDPMFVSATNLQIQAATPTPVEAKAMLIGTITKDIFGTDRDTETPDIGAHEGDFTEEIICETPEDQPTNLVLIPNPTTINGSFTASDADSYLVVRHAAETLVFSPVDLTYYTPGQSVGTDEVIVSASSATTILAGSLTASTQYYFSVFAYNQQGIGGPLYLTTTPLTGTMTTLPTAPADPATFTATMFSYDQINLAATANAAASPIMVAWNTTATFGTPLATGYSVDDPIVGGGTVYYIGAAADLPNHTDLDPQTTYYYKAWSLTGTERTTYYAYSTGLSANATTPQVPAVMPVAETFESSPTTWAIVNGTQTNKWHIGTATAYEGTKSAYISNDNGVSNAYTISSTSVVHMYRDVTFTEGASEFELSFMWKCEGEGTTYDYDNLKVFVTDITNTPVAGTAVNADFLVGDYWYNFSPLDGEVLQWASERVTLSNLYGGTTKRIIFSWKNDGSYGDQPPVAIDNVNLKAYMTPQPTALTVTAVTGTTANLNWTSEETTFDVQYGERDFMLGEGTTVSSVTKPYLLEDLDAATGYSYYVRANDGVDPSSWAGPYNFFTAFNTPYTTGFDTAETINGWVYAISAGAATVTLSTSTPVSAPQLIQMYQPSSNMGAEVRLFTPPFVDMNTKYARFYARASVAGRKLLIGTVPTTSATATFTQFAELTLTSTHTQYVVDFAAATTDQYIAFKVDTSDATASYIFIDDVNISESPWDELAVTAFTATPLYKFTDTEFTFNISVKNNGSNSTGKSITLKMGEDVIDTVPVGDLAFGATANLTYDWTPETAGTFTFTANAPVDENEANNVATLTDLEIFTLGQLAEGFEGEVFPPARWTRFPNPAQREWARVTSPAAGLYDGVAAAQLTISTVDDTLAVLATPALEFEYTAPEPGSRSRSRSNDVTFYARATTAGITVQPYYGTTEDIADYTALGDPISLTTTYTQYTVEDTEELNGHYRIAFQVAPNTFTGSVYLDKVVGPSIYIPLEPPGAAALLSPADEAQNINPYTVVLTWNEPGSGGVAAGYNVRISTDPEAYKEDDFDKFVEDGGLWDIVENRSYDVFAAGQILDFNTTYYWQIVPYSGSNDPSERADVETCVPFEFTTRTQLSAPTPLALGNVWANYTKTGTLVVTNNSTSAGLTFTPTADDFTFEGTAPYSIAAGGTYNLNYTFNSPGTLGAYTGSITLTENTPGEAVVTVAVTATILENPIIDVSETAFIEGFETGNTNGSTSIKNWTQAVGPTYATKYWTANSTNTTYNRTPRTGTFNATLQYSGQAWLFRPIMLEADTPYEIELYARQDGAVAANSNMKISYGAEASIAGMTNAIVAQTSIINGDYQRLFGTFTPASSGLFYIGINGWINGTPWYISLDDIKIREVPSVPEFSINPSATEYTYPLTVVNTPATKQYTITNTGGATLTINSIVPSGDYYTISSDLTDYTLEANQSASFTVQYLPTVATGAEEEHEGTVTITYGEEPGRNVAAKNSMRNSRATHVISLTGTCVDPRIIIPHTENFDAVTTPNLPLGWNKLISSTSSYASITTSTSTPNTSPNNVAFYNSSDTDATMILVSPEVIDDISSLKVSFSARWSSYAASISVGTMSDPANINTYTEFATKSLTSTHAPYGVNFSSYAGTDQYIAFKFVPTSTYGYMYLDSVVFEEAVANDMAATAIGGATYGFVGTPVTNTVTIKNNGTAAQSSYTVYLKSVETRATLATSVETTEMLTDATRVINLEWTPDTLGAIQVYGEVVLTGDETAANNVTSNYGFTTYRAGILMESFEGETFPPTGWAVVNNGDENAWTRYTTGPRTGLACASIVYDADDAHDDWLITPKLVPTEGDATFSFWAKNGSTTYIELFNVKLSTTTNEVASFTNVLASDIGPGIDYTQYTYDLSAYIGQNVYLAIQATSVDELRLFIDDVSGPVIYTAPEELDQPIVTISNVDGDIVLDWQDVDNAVSYKVYMSDDPEATDWGTPVMVGDSEYTFTPDTETKMFFKVHASTDALPIRVLDGIRRSSSNKKK